MRFFTALIIVVGTICCSSGVFAQPDTLWTKTYGGTEDDRANSVEQTPDGGFIMTGSSYLPGIGYKVYVLKTDSNGDTLWTKVYGNSGQVTRGNAVHNTTDGKYIVAGDMVGQIFLMKIDVNGDTLWRKLYNTIFEVARCNDMITTNDGGFILAGYRTIGTTLNDYYLIKVDSDGNIMWTKQYGGEFSDVANSIQQTTDGGYIVCGNTDISSSGTDIWLTKTDQWGDTLWTKTFGTSLNEYGIDVKQTNDEGFILSGTIENITKLWLIKTDTNGDTVWTKKYNYQIATNRYPKQGNSIIETEDSGFLIAGFSGINNSAGSKDIYLIRTNGMGDTLWTKSFSGLNVPDEATSVSQIDDGGFVVVGYSTDPVSARSDVWIARISSDATGVERSVSSNPDGFELEQNYPNPFNPSTKISWQSSVGSWQSLKVYDILGKEIATLVDSYKPAGNYEVNFNASNLPSGVYFYTINSGSFTQTKKMLLLK